jgi:hypothetical protein
MSGHGDTDNVLRLKLHRAKDALCFLDDFAPSDNWVKGAAAQWKTPPGWCGTRKPGGG